MIQALPALPKFQDILNAPDPKFRGGACLAAGSGYPAI